MTDEELKGKLLMFSGPLGWHRNPEGPQAVARIKELEAKIFHMSEKGAKNDPQDQGQS